MRPWHSVVVPHADIRRGHFDEGTFAASLSDVVARRGPVDYWDADTFFRKTYPTQGLVQLLAAIVGRLAGTGYGEAVIQIQTPFGGGKTHALVALYHLFRAMPTDVDLVAHVLAASGAATVPEVRTVAFDGTAADPVKGRSPWGELAAQLGRYDLLAEHDRRRLAPGKDLLHALLADAPTLILMDEIAEYAAKAKEFQGQVMAFFQELTETVKVLPYCALVTTLPSSAPYGEEGERALDQLQRIIGRVEAIYTPVEGTEIYEVIRRRLFEDLGDPQEAWHVAEAYWNLYQQLGEDIPAEAREAAYRERLYLAYPFHPQVIDILYERWSTFPTFQRTRGVLRLLAHVVADLYQRQHPAPLIQAAHLNLAHPQIRDEFLKHIGNPFRGVIAADIVDGNAKAQRIDHDMGSEYARFNVASGLATAIFFGSFSGSERRGISAASLRLALLHEGIPPAIVGDALNRLENELWYLHVEGGLYQFRSQPNLNRVILEREESVNEEDIANEIRERLERLAGSDMKVYLFPASPADIPDTRDLKLAVLSGNRPAHNVATEPFVRDLLNRTSSAFRAYRNTLLVLAADTGAIATLRMQIRRLLALKAIQADKNVLSTLSEEDKEALKLKIREAEGGIDFSLLTAYRYLARAGEEGIQWLDMGIPATGDRGPLTKRVRDFLREQDVLLDRLGPSHLLNKAMGQDEQEKPLVDLYEAFLRYPHLPLLAGEGVLWQAVQQGVKEGVFGLRSGENLYFQEEVPAYAVQAEAVLVRPEVARGEKDTLTTVTGSSTGNNVATSTDPTVAGGPHIEGVRYLFMRMRVPWGKMSDFMRGVLMPLREDNADLHLEITLEAQSPSGIQRGTLEQKVYETLRQIGAEVLDERKE